MSGIGKFSLALVALTLAACQQDTDGPELKGHHTNTTASKATDVDVIANNIDNSCCVSLKPAPEPKLPQPTIYTAEVLTDNGQSVIVDRQTGCFYIMLEDERGEGYSPGSPSISLTITPRLNRYGKPMCGVRKLPKEHNDSDDIAIPK